MGGTRKKDDPRPRRGEQTCGCQGGEGTREGFGRSMGLAEASDYIWNGWTTGPTVQHRELYSIKP